MKKLVLIFALCSLAAAARNCIANAYGAGTNHNASAMAWTNCPGGPASGDNIDIGNFDVIWDASAPTVIGSGGKAFYGSLLSITVTNGGSGYTAGNATFSGGTLGNGTAAAATCSVSGGVVTSIDLVASTNGVVGGSWYSTAPTSITCPGGTGLTYTVDGNYGGTPALVQGGTGSFTVASGVTTLNVRGDIQYTPNGTGAWFTASPGLHLTMDTSASATGIRYSIYSKTTGNSARWIDWSACTSSQPCVWDGGTGSFTNFWVNDSTNQRGQYLTMTNFGFTGYYGWRISPGATDGKGYTDLDHFTYTDNAPISIGTDIQASDTFRIRNSRFSNPRHANYGCFTFPVTQVARTTGVKDLSHNSFECTVNGGLGGSNTYMKEWNFDESAFWYALGDAGATSNKWSAKNIIIRRADSPTGLVANVGSSTVVGGDLDGAWLVLDTEAPAANGNAHGISMPTANVGNPAQTWKRIAIMNMVAGSASGNALWTGNTASPARYVLDSIWNFPSATAWNYMFNPGNYSTGTSNSTTNVINSLTMVRSGGGMIEWGHCTLGSNPGGIITGNILYDITKTSTYSLLADIDNQSVNTCTGSYTTFSSDTVDYNLTYPAPSTAPSAYLSPGGAVLGYLAKFTTTPGTHDSHYDPLFVDRTRTLWAFETAYLGHTPTRGTWTASPAPAYSAGDTVTYSNSGLLDGQTFMYRYTNSTGCSGANPTPGGPDSQTPTWRKCWEPAVYQTIKDAILAGSTIKDPLLYIDSTYNCNSGCSYIAASLLWSQRGLAARDIRACTANNGANAGPTPCAARLTLATAWW